MHISTIKVLGIPFSFGQQHYGVQYAYEQFKMKGLLKTLNRIAPTDDIGEIDLSLLKRHHGFRNFIREHESAVASFRISHFIERMDLSESFLLNIGGDHGLGLGVLHGLLFHQPNMITVWADAHGDINTPQSSLSGNFHGMPLSFILKGSQNIETFNWLKRTLPANKLILFGPRSLDPAETKIIQELEIQYYSSAEINSKGSRSIIMRALEIADPHGVCPIHLSLDVDLFDASDIISTGTREIKGPRSSEIFCMGKSLAATGRLKSMDIAELNPQIGTHQEVNAAIQTTKDFIKSTLSECFKQKTFSTHTGRESSYQMAI